MSKDQREVAGKLRILRHAEATGQVAKTCRYFGVGRSSFFRRREAYRTCGDAGLVNRPPLPKQHANRTPDEIEEKVLYLRSKYRSNSCGNAAIMSEVVQNNLRAAGRQ